ncbi:E3 ubiquitin-protein ligase BRE1B-like [Apteryx mantelli]|uniref:E3 ubiquitin protein ligase n=1 Tax=Apteryx mantelli TaxID=2696672 RepID=A0ABM4G1A8_9AVES
MLPPITLRYSPVTPVTPGSSPLPRRYSAPLRAPRRPSPSRGRHVGGGGQAGGGGGGGGGRRRPPEKKAPRDEQPPTTLIEPLRLGGISSTEEMDLKVLQFKNKKLAERLEQRQACEDELRERIEKLEKRQGHDDATLLIVNRYWGQGGDIAMEAVVVALCPLNVLSASLVCP